MSAEGCSSCEHDERTAEEWGRVAVALPGWRWMPGMSIPENDCNEAAMIWGPGGATVYDDDRGHLDHGEVDEDYDYPDPDDPATAGCLLALHNQGVGWRWVEVDTRAMGYRLCSWMGQGQPVTRGPLATTPGRACIAGAEVNGCWPGGGQ